VTSGGDGERGSERVRGEEGREDDDDDDDEDKTEEVEAKRENVKSYPSG